MIQRFDRFFIQALLILSISFGIGCVGPWEKALREDTPASYYHYMRDHPDSEHHVEAQEHLDFLKLKRDLNLRTYAAFLKQYPGSPLADEIRPRLEPHAMKGARAAGTESAYESFLASFPNGKNAARARGNLIYIGARGYGGRLDELAAFADAHPKSDFAAEARRSVEASRLRDRSRFDRVGLSIELAADVPDHPRWRREFYQRAQSIYAEAGRELVLIPEIVNPALARTLPVARLTIRHSERAQQTSIEAGRVSRPGMLATTWVSLQRDADSPPIFRREFSLRVDSTEHARDSSVLASTASGRYWQEFFVPVSTWQTNALVRPPVELEGDVVDVDAVGDRAVVLYENGAFQLIELSDPEKPAVIAQYERPNDLKKWSGVAILGDRVAIFGEEGIEMLGFGATGPEVVRAYDRSKIGTIFAIEPLGQHLAVAGARGLMVMDPATGSVRRVMRRAVNSLAVVGDELVFSDGESIFVSKLELLREKRVSAQFKLGKGAGVWRIRSVGRRAVALGHDTAWVIDLSAPGKPVLTAQLAYREVGQLNDAAAVRGRIFLLGTRGLQMMDAGANRLIESIDVAPNKRMASMGRHLVAVGAQQLQVVDASPLTARSVPADGASR